MIRFEPVEEPEDFDERVREPGRRWLATHRGSTKRPPSYWIAVREELANAFRDLCAYSAIHVAYPGAVDHFVPLRGRSGKRRLAYEWSNYRYASHSINSRKGDRDPRELLDPFEVQDEWFELLLPSCQLVLTDACPEEYRSRARTMLEELGLGHHEDVIRYRRQWLECYEQGKLNLEGLERFAPLIARAVRKQQAQHARKGRRRRT
jgi:hypothetical protein